MIKKWRPNFFVILLCLLLIPNVSVISSLAVSDTIYDVAEESVELNTTKVQEKIPCQATLNDDFEDDSVLVMFKKETSQSLISRSKQDFPEIQVKSVKDLTSSTGTLIKEKRKALADKNKTAAFSTISVSQNQAAIATEIAELEELENNYNQIIEIELKTGGKQNVLNAVKELEKREDILIAQPNYYYFPCAVPNDPYVGEQWTIDQLNLERAWDITTGSSDVLVGVVDSGVDRTHEDLAGNIDIAASRDFTGENQPFNDASLHGTDVAGVIGAIGNNNKGFAGICWNVKIASLRVLAEDGAVPNIASTNVLVNAVDHSRAKGIFVLNFSLRGYTYDGILENEINNFPGLVVCGVGNEGTDNDVTPAYPASFNCLNIISVGGSNRADQPGSGSNWATNYGKNSVDLFAPAVDICTPTAWGGYSSGFCMTSAAAPHVTGVAALIKSKYPDLSASRIKTLIMNSVDKNASLASKCVSGGRLNAYSALNQSSSYFTVSYNANGGSGIMTNTRVYYGETTALRKNSFTRAGYDFDCWYVKRSSDSKWRYWNPGDTSQSGWYTEGAQPSGWVKVPYKDGGTVSQTVSSGQTVTLYAQWKKYYIVRYNANGGSGSMADTKVTYGVTTALRKNSFTRAGYDFDCWYVKRSSTGQWAYRNPSNTSQSGWYAEGSQPSGWVKTPFIDGGTVSQTVSNPGEVVTLYAQWKKYYIVRYNANGGSGTMADTKVYYGISTPLRKNTFTRTGYNFNCWYVKRGSTGQWAYRNPSNTSQSGWYAEGSQPSGWIKTPFIDGGTVSQTVSNPGEVVTLYAQWK